MKIETTRISYYLVLAKAVRDIYPDVKLGTGSIAEDGFCYDFEFENTIGTNDLLKIEKKMKEIINQNFEIEKEVSTLQRVSNSFKKQQQSYKQEIIKKLKEKGFQELNIYKIDDFKDFCVGPCVNQTSKLDSKAFKLNSVSGAYWQNDDKNSMLQRICGVAFENEEKLNEYLEKVKLAKERDHRKLGKELDLFTFSDLVGSGLPLFTPKGMVIIDELKRSIEKTCSNYGFKKVMTPHLAKIDLFELSGHAKKFGGELFRVTSEKGHEFALKPVQCPHQTQIYASKIRSYRDLPIRYMESEKQYRAEKSGEVGGLNRVYAITIEDGHSFCRVDQVEEEIKGMVNIIKDFYSMLGLWGNHWVSLSLRDYSDQNKYIGDPKEWDECENMLEKVAEEMDLKAKKVEGEAALYGPKLDFMFRDSLGKEIQIPTVQLDFATPKRFNLTYIDKNSKEVNPVMIHRAILGSYERFLALLIEHFGGAFPFWLSPVQINVIPVSDKTNEYAEKIVVEMEKNDFRVEINKKSESLGKKIREAEKQKIPYILVVGEKEQKDDSVSVRERKNKKERKMKINSFIKKIKKEKNI